MMEAAVELVSENMNVKYKQLEVILSFIAQEAENTHR